MNWLSSLKNQTVLLALVGLGVLNGLLCGVMILRENSNTTQIVRLESEAKAAMQSQQAKTAELKAGLESEAKAAAQVQQTKADELKVSLVDANKEMKKLRSDLESVSKDLANAQDENNKTAAKLDDTSVSLKKAVAELQAVRLNNPWLADTKQRRPWDVQIEKLLKDKKKLNEKKK